MLNFLSHNLEVLIRDISSVKELEEAQAFIDAQHIGDFEVHPGRIRIRVGKKTDKNKIIDIETSLIDSERWHQAAKKIAVSNKAYAHLVAGIISETLYEIFKSSEIELNLEPNTHLKFYENRVLTESLDSYAIAALLYLANQLKIKSTLILPLLGKEDGDFLIEVKHQRKLQNANLINNFSEEESNSSKNTTITLEEYWRFEGKENFEFKIIADELPAAMLRRLDTLPIDNFSHEIEELLEESYVKIATRAQAYAINF